MSFLKQAWRASLCFLITALLGVSLSQAAVTINENEYLVFYHHDALGSPAATTNEKGQILSHESSKPFGGSTGKTSSDGNPLVEGEGADNESRLGYTGHSFDGGSELVYMKARFYDPAIGRFYSNDPLGFRLEDIASFNRFSYANNNPINYTDPTGMATGTTGYDELADGETHGSPNAEIATLFASGESSSPGNNNVHDPYLLNPMDYMDSYVGTQIFHQLTFGELGGSRGGNSGKFNPAKIYTPKHIDRKAYNNLTKAERYFVNDYMTTFGGGSRGASQLLNHIKTQGVPNLDGYTRNLLSAYRTTIISTVSVKPNLASKAAVGGSVVDIRLQILDLVIGK